MKIQQDVIVPTQKPKEVDQPSRSPNTNTSATKNTTVSGKTNPQLIQQWFSRVGIKPGHKLQDTQEKHKSVKRRISIKELQQTENLANILEIALHVTVGESSGDSLDPDWFHAFIELAENIYSATMQELWAKIFAVELSHPGSFSLRSLQTLKSLTQRDAKLFERAVQLASRPLKDPTPRIITGYHERPGLLQSLFRKPPAQINLSQFGMSYPNLLALIDMGLIYASEIETGELNVDVAVPWRHAAYTYQLIPKRPGLALVYYKFTAVGAELFKLVARQESTNYIAILTDTLKTGFTIES